jgi:hypothetical protein
VGAAGLHADELTERMNLRVACCNPACRPNNYSAQKLPHAQVAMDGKSEMIKINWEAPLLCPQIISRMPISTWRGRCVCVCIFFALAPMCDSCNLQRVQNCKQP